MYFFRVKSSKLTINTWNIQALFELSGFKDCGDDRACVPAYLLVPIESFSENKLYSCPTYIRCDGNVSINLSIDNLNQIYFVRISNTFGYQKQ